MTGNVDTKSQFKLVLANSQTAPHSLNRVQCICIVAGWWGGGGGGRGVNNDETATKKKKIINTNHQLNPPFVDGLHFVRAGCKKRKATRRNFPQQRGWLHFTSPLSFCHWWRQWESITNWLLRLAVARMADEKQPPSPASPASVQNVRPGITFIRPTS